MILLSGNYGNLEDARKVFDEMFEQDSDVFAIETHTERLKLILEHI